MGAGAGAGVVTVGGVLPELCGDDSSGSGVVYSVLASGKKDVSAFCLASSASASPAPPWIAFW